MNKHVFRVKQIVLLMICFCSFNLLKAQFNVSGDAVSTGSGCYQITDGNSQSGAVWNTSMIDLSQPFEISLTLNFGSDNGGGGWIVIHPSADQFWSCLKW